MAILVLLHENLTIQKIPLDHKGLRFGRKLECDVFIDDNMVSMEHAVLEVQADPKDSENIEYYIHDLDSTNHTFVNGKAVARQKLNNNDLIRIGLHTFKFIEKVTPEEEKTLKLHKSWIPGVYYTKD